MRGKRRTHSKMAEVARRAGVSLSTVSRALSGSPLISEETRRTVHAAAEQLDYRVDAAGSSLRTGLTRTIGVVIPLSHSANQGFSDPFFLEILGAVADELSACGYNMLLAKVTDDPGNWITHVARGRRADGVIVIGQSLYHESLNRHAAEFPTVVWGARIPGQKYVSIGSDNESGGHDATQHLLSQGCRRIVFLGDPTAPEVAARLQGHLRALAEARVESQPALQIPVRFGSDTAYHAVGGLLSADVEFDGVMACSDGFAIGAMRALAERGRKVPADVAVIGFDDIPFAAHTMPPLTTMRQDCRAGARLLVEALLRIIRHERASTVVIPTQLVVRASSLREHFRSAGTPTPGPARSPKTRKPRAG